MQGGDLAHMKTDWYLYFLHLCLLIDTSGYSFSDGHRKTEMKFSISTIKWR